MEFRTEYFITLLLALLLVSTAQAQKVYRWVDKDGNVHYTESLPPDYGDAGHDVLNQDGLVLDENQRLTPEQKEPEKSEDEIKALEAGELPRDASGQPRAKPLYTEAEKQARMDSLLLLRFDSEQEIIDAMNVEIRQLTYDRRLLEGSSSNLKKTYRDYIGVAANKQRAGVKVSNKEIANINDLKKKLARNNASMDALARREDQIRAEFLETIERYRALLEKYAEDNPG